MTPSILPMVNGQIDQIRPFDHGYSWILAMFMVKKWPFLTIWPRQFWNFGHGHGQKFFDHLTMTPGRRPNGQKIVVILPPPKLIVIIVPEILSDQQHSQYNIKGHFYENFTTLQYWS